MVQNKSCDQNQNGLKTPNQNLDQSGCPLAKKSDYQNVIRGPEQPLIEGLRSMGEEIFDQMVQHGEKTALIDADTGASQTYSELLKRSVSIALGLRNRGVTTGDVISLVELVTDDSFAIVLGTLFAGASINMLDGQWTVANTVPYLLPRLKPRVIFCHINVLDKVQKVIKEHFEILQDSELVVYGAEKCDHCKTLEEFVENGEEEIKNFRPTVIDDIDNTAGLILCTSGSTGVPKGVMLQHRHLATMMKTTGKMFPSGLSTFTNSPCYWSTGSFMFLIGAYSGNTKIYTKKTFNEDNVLGIIQKYKVNLVFLSCFQVSMLNQFADTDKYDLSSVFVMLCGGSRLTQKHLDQMQERLKNGIIAIGYGMTEMIGGTGLQPGSDVKPGSVGKLGAGMSLKIVDPDSGLNQGPDQPGEIYLHGPTMLGYLGDPVATRNIIDHQGWLRTGDIGYYDQDHYVYITDRCKEIAKFRGAYINPSDIEDVLSCHPAVRSSAVVSVSHDDTCDLMVGFVELKTDREDKITQEDIEEYANGLLEDFQKLRGGVHILEKLPILTHGKVARPAVKKIANEMKENIVQHYKNKYNN